jgi:hypothetical protein
MSEYVAPELNLSAFNCPYCNAYATMNWYDTYIHSHTGHFTTLISPKITTAKCTRCINRSAWNGSEMIIPSHSTAPIPHKDMPEFVKNDYLEAREILNKSPRGACALLRLAIQKLCDNLVIGDKKLNDKIAELVKQGLPNQLQKAFDLVRVVGNNAVHPGEINIEDNPEIALKLFKLINLIIEKMITEPKEVSDFFDETIPQNTKKAIAKRDSK